MANETNLIRELRSQDRMVRLFALEEVIHEGNSQLLLEALRGQKLQENDDECKTLLEHAIRAVEIRLFSSKTEMGNPDQAAFLAIFRNAGSERKVEILADIKPPFISYLASQAAELVAGENDPQVKAMLIRALGPQWPEGRVDVLFSCLKSSSGYSSAAGISETKPAKTSPSGRFAGFGGWPPRALGTPPSLGDRGVFLATFQVLSQKAPAKLVTFLPTMLSSSDARMKKLALRALATVDPEETLNYIEDYLLSQNPDLQRIALATGFHVPFSRFKEKLFKLFAIDAPMEILREAGDFFLFNPDPEIPFKLLDLQEKTSGEKNALCKELADGACQAIKSAGILAGDFDSFLRKLQGTILRRNSERSLRFWINSFLMNRELQMVEMEAAFRKQSENQETRQVLESLLKKEYSLEDQQFIERLLARSAKVNVIEPLPTAKVAPLQVPPSPPPSGIVPEKSTPVSDRIREIAQLQVNPSPDARRLIDAVLDDPGSTPELLVTALRTARLLSTGLFVVPAQRLLKHQNDTVVAEAITYLGHVNIDLLATNMGYFLKTGTLRVKTAVMGVLKDHDPVQALRNIQILLEDPNQRLGAIEWMFHLDYGLVRETLTRFLVEKANQEEFEVGLVLIRSNPDPENLYILYLLGQESNLNWRKKIMAARKETIATLLSLQLVSEKGLIELERQIEARYAESRRRKTANIPNYSIKALRPVERTLEGHGWGLWVPAGGLALMGLLGWFFFGGGNMMPIFSPRSSVNQAVPAAVSPFFQAKKPVSNSPNPDHFRKFSAERQDFLDATPAQIQELQEGTRRRADLLSSISEMLSRSTQK